MSDKFCGACNRVRLLSDGSVKPCLGRKETYDLRPLLGDADRLYAAICEVIYNKPAGHRFENAEGLAPMNRIGG